MENHVKSFFKRYKAASLTGYGLIVGLIAVLAIGAISSVGGQVNNLFGIVSIDLENAVNGNSSSNNGSSNNNSAPSISGLAASATTDNNTDVMLSFTISDDNTIAASLLVSAVVTNIADGLVSNPVLATSCIADACTVTITPPSGELGTATIEVTVEDELGLQTTAQTIITFTSFLVDAVHFDATVALVGPSPTSFDRTNFTMSFWVKKPADTGVNIGLQSGGGANYFQALVGIGDFGSPVAGVAYDGNGVSNGSRLTAMDFVNPTYRFNARASSTPGHPQNTWTHIVYILDTSQAQQEQRIRLFVDNVELTNLESRFGAPVWPTQNFQGNVGNSVEPFTIGFLPAFSYYFGDMAEVFIISGVTALPSEFGEMSGGNWIPKEYSGVTPEVYLSVRPGDVASDFLTNRGSLGDFTHRSIPGSGVLSLAADTPSD